MKEEKSKVNNPWVKDYDVAFTYHSSEIDYVRQLDRELSEKLGRDNVFFDQAEEYQLRFTGTDLVSALPIIYSQSKIVVVVFGLGYTDSKFCGWEFRYVLQNIFDRGDFSAFLLRQEGVTLPEEIKNFRCSDISQHGIEKIVREIVSRVRLIRLENGHYTNFREDSGTEPLDFLKRHFPIIIEHHGKKYCYALDEEREKGDDCIIGLTSITIATLIGAKQKLIRFSRICNFLRWIRLFLIQVEIFKAIKVECYRIEKCNELKETLFKLLMEFLTEEELMKDIDELAPTLVERFFGFLTHYNRALRNSNIMLCRNISSYLFETDVANIGVEITTTIRSICSEAGFIANNLFKNNKIFDKETAQNWSKKHLCGPSIPIKEIPNYLKSYSIQIQKDFVIERNGYV